MVSRAQLARLRKMPAGITVSGGTFRSGSYRGSTLTLPLSYAIEFSEDSRKKQLKFRLPVTYIQVEGGDVFSAPPGVALTLPVSDSWSLTPTVSYGVTGSVDLASASQMLGGTLTSRKEFDDLRIKDTKVTLANMIGYLTTLKVAIGDIVYDPGIVNMVYKNGITVESPLGFQMFEWHPVTLEASYTHSYFAGTELFLNQYHEVAPSMGSGSDALDWLPSDLQRGVTSVFGEDFDSFTAISATASELRLGRGLF